jgi:hypothetical protein
MRLKFSPSQGGATDQAWSAVPPKPLSGGFARAAAPANLLCASSSKVCVETLAGQFTLLLPTIAERLFTL